MIHWHATDRHRWAKTALIALALCVVLIQFIQIARKPRGDFSNHWEFGRRMISGEFIYGGGLDVPYLPLWSLAHSPLTVVPPHAAQLLVFPLFLIALVALLWILNRLTLHDWPLSADAAFWTVAVTLILSSRWLIRDMVECGVNLALVTLSWLAIYLWIHRKEWLGGICLGLAASLKCTPLAFLAYFLWKRQWKMALVTTLATAFFTLAPAVWMGPQLYRQSMIHWYTYASRGLSEKDPTQGVLGEETVQNYALRPALARVLMRIPSEHALRAPDALHVDLLHLTPKAAGLVIKAFMLFLALAVAWRFRSASARGSQAVLWECAAISLAVLLYSPITWSQHCVGALPALYLMVRSTAAEKRAPAWLGPVAAVYVFFVLLLNRTVLGRDISLVLLSYHVYTWCFLGLLFATLGYHSRAWQTFRSASLTIRRGRERRIEIKKASTLLEPNRL